MNLRHEIGNTILEGFGNAVWEGFRSLAFRKEAEEAHIFTLRALETCERLKIAGALSYLYCSPYTDKPTAVAGMRWDNPVGLAAGFSKNGEALEALSMLGFGCIEIGTITPRPQLGNPRPRVFRYPESRAVINRYGFNSEGSKAVVKRIDPIMQKWRWRSSIPPIIYSIGANKSTLDAYGKSGDLEVVVADYVAAFADLSPQIRGKDGVQINISSPNTPGLRSLFDRLPEFLGSFIQKARQTEYGLHLPPLILKVPPDGLTPEDYRTVVVTATECGIRGIEATNTTADEHIKKSYGMTEAGGVSGDPLRLRANECLAHLRASAEEKSIDLIGVGGIMNARHAEQKWRAGAKAIQIYTGLVFRGPRLIGECLETYHELTR